MDAYDLITSGLQLRKLLAKRVEPIMEEYGLRPVELDILEFITKENIDTAKEIIHRIHLSKSHISKSLEHLLEKGLINMKEDEDHAGVKNITSTEDMMKKKLLKWLKSLTNIMQAPTNIFGYEKDILLKR